MKYSMFKILWVDNFLYYWVYYNWSWLDIKVSMVMYVFRLLWEPNCSRGFNLEVFLCLLDLYSSSLWQTKIPWKVLSWSLLSITNKRLPVVTLMIVHRTGFDDIVRLDQWFSTFFDSRHLVSLKNLVDILNRKKWKSTAPCVVKH